MPWGLADVQKGRREVHWATQEVHWGSQSMQHWTQGVLASLAGRNPRPSDSCGRSRDHRPFLTPFLAGLGVLPGQNVTL